MTTKTCTNGHTMTGIGFDECPECEAPWIVTQTVEEKSHSEEWGAWRFVSEMLSTPNPDPELARAGIYNTSKCYEQIHDFVVEQKRKAFEEGVKAEREAIRTLSRRRKR